MCVCVCVRVCACVHTYDTFLCGPTHCLQQCVHSIHVNTHQPGAVHVQRVGSLTSYTDSPLSATDCTNRTCALVGVLTLRGTSQTPHETVQRTLMGHLLAGSQRLTTRTMQMAHTINPLSCHVTTAPTMEGRHRLSAPCEVG